MMKDADKNQLEKIVNLIPMELMGTASSIVRKKSSLGLRRKKQAVRKILLQLHELDQSETLFHLEIVGKISAFLSRKLKIEEKTVEEIELFAKLHDVGKIGVPSKILNKPGKLTEDEFEVIKTHTEIGYQCLDNLGVSKLGLDIVRYHHEKWNGKGYRGLVADEIPLAAKIVAIADVYDALRMDRPYKDSMSHEKAMDIILNDEGHFDPALVELFLINHQEIRNIYNVHVN